MVAAKDNPFAELPPDTPRNLIGHTQQSSANAHEAKEALKLSGD
jgi:hypothetical protein